MVTGNQIWRSTGSGADVIGAGNTIRANTVSEKYVGARVRGADNNVIRNRVANNETDGIQVEDDTATVSANTATDNGALRLVAPSPVRGRGGNRASGNGDPTHSVNVPCLTGSLTPGEVVPVRARRRAKR